MRPLAEDDLERLETFLCGLPDAMALSELDGYLAGVIVCPELIPPSEWLPQVWGGVSPGFENLEEANELLGIVMALYNDIIRLLNTPGDYAPRLDEDADGGQVWELWASGFGKALDLNPFAWEDLDARPEDDPDAMAIRVLDTLAHAADTPGGSDLPEELTQALRDDAVDILGSCVEDLHRTRLAARKPHRRVKIPRNAPCPCGSGKKYKKCCLQAENP